MFKKLLLMAFLSFFAQPASASLVVDAGGPYLLESGSDLVLDGTGTSCTADCSYIASVEWFITPRSGSEIATLSSVRGATVSSTIAMISWSTLCPVGSCLGSLATIDLHVFGEKFNVIPIPISGGDTTTLEIIPPSAVPIPATVWLLGTSLLGLMGLVKRRKSA